MTRLNALRRLFNRSTTRYASTSTLRRLSTLLIMIALLAPTGLPIRSSASSRMSGAETTEMSTLAAAVNSVVAALGIIFKKMKGSAGKNSATTKPSLKPQENPAVVDLELTPSEAFELQLDDQITMMAIPLDDTGNAVQGVIAEWTSSDEAVVSITGEGEATANSVGRAVLTASAGGQSATAEVTVVEMPFARTGEGPLPDDETESLYAPANMVGAPPGKTMPAASTAAAATGGREMPGSSNFSFGVPLVSLPGRGIDVSAGLIYNSRLWNRSTQSNERTRLTYNVDSSWPAPGFRLGYGQLETQGTDNLTLIDPDGTRHEMRKIPPANESTYVYESTDGTFIRYSAVTETVTYTDGTRVQYDVGGTGSIFYPTRITDRHGNYITISYAERFQPQIKSIQDTVGRFIRFYYTNNELTSITAPTYRNQLVDGSRERTVVRFYYTNLSVSGSFASSVDVTGPSSAQRLIQHIYFPNTQSGYAYDYSTYGMIYRIRQLRGMTANTSAVTQEGALAATTTYDYQGAPGGQPVPAGGLIDAPLYKRRTDDWAGRTGSTPDPFYLFSMNEENRTVTVTAPDQTVSEMKSIKAPGQWNDGLVESTTIRNGSNILAKTAISWEHDGNFRNPRPTRVEVTNDGNQTRATLYTVYDEFNNVKEVRELNFSAPGTDGAELRRTVTSYLTNNLYLNRRLVSLPASIETYAVGGASTTLVSKVDYDYDTDSRASLPAYTDIKMHEAKYNPAFPASFDATIRSGDLTIITAYPDVSSLNDETKKIVTRQFYDIAGNVVKAKLSCCQYKTFNYSVDNQYAYLMSETRGSGSTQLTTTGSYDKYTGVTLAETDENGQTTSMEYEAQTLRLSNIKRPDGGYTINTYDDRLYAEPDPEHTHSMVVTRTGPADSDGGDVTSYQYFDGRGALTRAFVDNSAQGYITTDIAHDKMGRVEKVSNSYETPYANRSTQPINPTSKWTRRAYDSLGRVTAVTLADGNLATNENVIRTTYSGVMTTVIDPAGKSRRQITDALGRIVRLDEPDATGSLGPVDAPVQATYYWHDLLDNVVQIKQGATLQGGNIVGGQTRYFMYDALSRLIRERQVEEETPAPHNLTDPLTGNSAWSARYEYNDNEHGLLTDSYDARLIHTHFDYDPTFHRLTNINYSGGVTTNPDELLGATPNVTYNYGNDAAAFNKGRLIKVETAAITTTAPGTPTTAQEYSYDSMGRTNAQRQTVGSNSYMLAYSFNKLGQLRSQTYPSGRVVSYGFKHGAHLDTVRDSSRTYLTNMTYSATGRLESETIGNDLVALTRSFGYNIRQQLSRISLTKGNTTLQRYDYKYGIINESTGEVDENRNNGQIARIEGFIGGGVSNPAKQWQQRMAYDSLGRLAKVAEHRGDNASLTYKANYNYDVFGNRYQYQSQNPATGQEDPQPYTRVEDNEINKSNNRFIQTGTTPVKYDSAGEIIEDRKFRSLRYSYDANGRQRSARKITGNGEMTSVYDGLGQRVATKIDSDDWSYLVHDISGQIVAEYGGVPDGTSGVRFIMSDHQGSKRVIINGSGAVVARRDYLPFGEEAQPDTGQRTGAQGYGVVEATGQRYASTTRRDDATGLDHTWWRKYDSSAGRWTTPDPYKGSMSLSDPQSLNRYSYVQNDPVNFVDPTGLVGEPLNNNLNQGIEAARSALSGGLCRMLFRNYRGSPEKLLEVIANPANKLLSVSNMYPTKGNSEGERIAFKAGADIGAITTFRTVEPYQVEGNTFNAVVTINSNGFFSTLKVSTSNNKDKRLSTFKDKGFYGLNDSQIRGAVILHELAHVAGAIPSDLTDKKQSQKNSERVRLLCFSALNDVELKQGTLPPNLFDADLGGGGLGAEASELHVTPEIFPWSSLHSTDRPDRPDPEGPRRNGPNVRPVLRPFRPRPN
ncbi:MAG: RHS repeat-associated core domain-containing protein [Pyrinomonadaceae bacterium]